jgi:hypothetical protein
MDDNWWDMLVWSDGKENVVNVRVCEVWGPVWRVENWENEQFG